MTEETKQKIDNMAYESMLSLWRNAPSEHLYFQGEVGKYFSDVMAKKRSEISDAGYTASSKSIGWDE